MDISPQPDYEANQPTTRQWVIVGVVALIVICGIALFLSGGYYAALNYFEARQERATQTAAAATAIVAQKYDLIADAKRWPLLLSDTFDTNAYDWREGEFDDEYALMEFSIGGTYTWEMSTKKGVVWRVWPRSDSVDDFYLSVDAKNAGEDRNTQYGLIFRNNDNSFFFFEVRDTQEFRVLSSDDWEWTELIPLTESAAIYPGQFNHLEIVARGDRFYFLINETLVGEISASYPEIGQAGLAIGADDADIETTVVYDNFELRGNRVEQ
jgi:hypothetical protein